MKNELKKLIKEKKAKIAVLGMGYVGLPIALAFCEKGFKCIGIDTNPEKIKELKKGKSPLAEISSKRILAQIKNSRLTLFSDYKELKKADCIIICVPTPLSKSKDPDFSFVLGAVEEVGKRLQPNQLVVIESTIYPGMTVEVIAPKLRELSGLEPGKDFYLAMSPERIDPGNKKYTLKNTPRVVGGINRKSTRLAQLLYQQVIERTVPVSSPTVAEMTKLLENTFRSINIGLVNEIAIICDRLGIDVWEVIDSASTKPFGFMTFYPGPGIGGHCIPVDPIYLSWKMKSLNYRARFIELASEINAQMPQFWVGKIQAELNQRKKCLKDAKILLLGITYKKDVPDLRESPALEIFKLLLQHRSQVAYSDPLIAELEIEGKKFKSRPLTKALVQKTDCVVITTDHSAFDYQMIKNNAQLIVDTRGVLHRLGLK